MLAPLLASSVERGFNVRELSDNVWAPVPPPTVRDDAVNVVSSVTVYVPSSAMTTGSAVCGTRPRLQLEGVLHKPPAGLVHLIAVAVMLNAALLAPVRPVPLAVSV